MELVIAEIIHHLKLSHASGCQKWLLVVAQGPTGVALAQGKAGGTRVAAVLPPPEIRQCQ